MAGRSPNKPGTAGTTRPAKPKTANDLIEKAAQNASDDELAILSILQAGDKLIDDKEAATDETLRKRIEWYLREYCVEAKTAPCYEGLALALGIDLETLGEWRDGKCDLSYESKKLIKRTILYLASVDYALVLKDMMPQTVYQARCRNYYGIRESAPAAALPAEKPSADDLLNEALKLPDVKVK